MKKIKIFLPVLMALVMLLSIPFAAACKNKKKDPQTPYDPGLKYTLQEITLDTSSVKKDYELGDTFTSAGLTVSARFQDSEGVISHRDVTTDSAVAIDSAEFNKDIAGVYTIYVSYTYETVTRYAYYDVTVSSPVYGLAGLEVKFEDGSVEKDLELTQGATFDLKTVKVYKVNENGVAETTPLAASAYAINLYLAGEKQENTEGVVSVTRGGVYTVLASMPFEQDANYTLKGMAFLYAVNNPSSIAEVTPNAEAVYQQDKGADVISSTWKFTVTYSNGTTKEVKSGDAGLTITLDTKVVGDDKTANVSYTETNPHGQATTPVTCSVTYSVKEPTGPVLAKEYTVEYKVTIVEGAGSLTKTYLSGDEDPEATNVSVVLNGATTFGTNSKTTSSANGSVTYADRVEIKKNKTVDITLASGLTDISIDVYASHTTGDTARTLIIGTTRNTSTEGTSLSITGGSSVELSVMKLADAQAGKTYYVSTEDIGNSTQTIHFYAVRITYTVPGDEGGDETTTYTYDFSELQAKLLERVKALPQNQNPNNDNAPYYTEDTLGDKIQLEASDFEGTKNGFITFLSAGTSKSTQYRTSSGGCIEIKGDRLQFTLTKPGTVTVIFSSTGTNADSDSDIALKDASGNYMTSNGTPATDNGYYTAHGTGQVTITFVVSQAGTYTLTTGTSTHDRAARIYGITVVDGTN